MKRPLTLTAFIFALLAAPSAMAVEVIDGIPCSNRFEISQFANGKLLQCHIARNLNLQTVPHGGAASRTIQCRSDSVTRFNGQNFVVYCVQTNGQVFDARPPEPAKLKPPPVKLGPQPMKLGPQPVQLGPK